MSESYTEIPALPSFGDANFIVAGGIVVMTSCGAASDDNVSTIEVAISDVNPVFTEFQCI